MLYTEPYILGSDAEQLRQSILDCKNWERYDNPFERKSVMRKPYDRNIDLVTQRLTQMIFLAEKLTDVSPLSVDYEGQYTAVFKYDVDDYLSVHRDAERDPLHFREKIATACLYLSTDDQIGSPLEFYTGAQPEQLTAVIQPIFNTLIMFDNYWHGCPQPVLHGTRIVITVSFMGHRTEYGRERAYFAPKPGEMWSKEICELRDLRCDPFRYHEVYRV